VSAHPGKRDPERSAETPEPLTEARKLLTGLSPNPSFSLPERERFWPFPPPTPPLRAPPECARDLSSRHPPRPGIAKSCRERPKTDDAEGALPRRRAVNRCVAVSMFGKQLPVRDSPQTSCARKPLGERRARISSTPCRIDAWTEGDLKRAKRARKVRIPHAIRVQRSSNFHLAKFTARRYRARLAELPGFDSPWSPVRSSPGPGLLFAVGSSADSATRRAHPSNPRD
jgi:hypothetical protein